MSNGPGVDMAADLSNTGFLAFLQDKVLARLSSIDTHLATINGTVAHHVKEIAANKAKAAAIEKQQQANCLEIVRLQERDTHQKERLRETRLDTKDLLNKAWENTTRIAALVAAIGILTKLANLW